MDINIEKNNDRNSELAHDYMSRIHDAKGRALLRKDHSELEVAIQSYEYILNRLSNFPIPESNKKKLLDNVAEHYAGRVSEHDSKPLTLDDGAYARTIFERVRVNRNEESAKYFHDNIETLVFSKNARMPDSHSELNNAYDQYIKSIGLHPNLKESIRAAITQQIKFNSPESIAPVELEHSR